jgi:ankyrin repeat protein
VVDYFLSRGADINEIAREFGTALHVAACMGNPDMVEFLISRGASVNARGGDHGTALLAAPCGRQEGIALSLIKAGADTEGENIWEEDALVLASSFGYLPVVKAALHQGNIHNIGKALKGAI